MTEPKCPYFGKCGGCSFQDLGYPLQLEQKQENLKQAIQNESIEIFTGKEYFYRNRMDFVFSSKGLGLREKGFYYKFVGLERCVISNDHLNELLTEVREFFKEAFYFDVKKRYGEFCYAVIRTSQEDSSVSIVLNKNSKRLNSAVDKVKEYTKISTARNVLATYIPYNRNVSVSDDFDVLKGHDFLTEEILGKHFQFPIQGFFQVNHEMAEKIHEYCRGLLSEYSTENALLIDLYGGVGTFGIINAGIFKMVTMIENYEPAVQSANINSKFNDKNNVSTKIMDAKNLKQLEFNKPFFIIMDPPRSGIHPKTLKQINQLNPEVLIFISCNPKLLKQDLTELSSYTIKSAALFDMFPQTPHMEVVLELIKNRKS